jgi:hypothetical protein
MIEHKRQWLKYAATFSDSKTQVNALRRQAKERGLRLTARKQESGGWLIMS